MGILNNKIRTQSRYDKKLSYNDFNSLQDTTKILQNITIDGKNFYSMQNPTGVHISLGDSEAGVLSDINFAVKSIVGNTVTINGGEVQWGVHVPATLDEEDFSITANNQYIGIQFNFSTNVLTWINPTTNRNQCLSDETYFRTWLVKIAYIDSIATIANVGWQNNILIPSVFGDA